MREGFLLDPDVAHLNHGSFGACPVPVFEEYQRLQLELERGPTDFFTRRIARWFWNGKEEPGRLAEARAALAAFVGARADDLVFVPNATSGLNAVIRSLRLGPDDEVLTTAHEYGAITRTWEFAGARLVVCEPEELVARIGPRTRAVSVSHITSPTALLFPVAEICAAARRAGVLAIVDGAHAPGHVPLDLEAIGADVYAGNCHKWMCAPKGAGFLWARPEHQGWIAPLVVSWGYREDADFAERHGWAGTRDPAAYLTVPKAIEVHGTFDAAHSRALADLAEERLAALGLPRVPGEPAPYMRAVELSLGDPDALWARLYEEFRVEVPVYEWGGGRLLRFSIGPYNDEDDVDRLAVALESCSSAVPHRVTHTVSVRRRSDARTAPGASTHTKWPAPSTTSTHAPGMRSAASVDAPSGIGLREPWTKPTGTRMVASPASSTGSSERIDRPISAERSLDISRSGICGAAAGSAKYAGQTRRTPRAPARRRRHLARSARRAHAPARARPPAFGEAISSSNSGQRPSPTQPSGSTASTPRTRAGSARATCRARCPPHEWPTTYAFSQASVSSTRRASSTSAATVYGPPVADGASPRC
jgi:isopenicillin-N epimerase